MPEEQLRDAEATRSVVSSCSAAKVVNLTSSVIDRARTGSQAQALIGSSLAPPACRETRRDRAVPAGGDWRHSFAGAERDAHPTHVVQVAY